MTKMRVEDIKTEADIELRWKQAIVSSPVISSILQFGRTHNLSELATLQLMGIAFDEMLDEQIAFNHARLSIGGPS